MNYAKPLALQRHRYRLTLAGGATIQIGVGQPSQAMPRAGAPMNAWPEIAVSLRGPVTAPRRTIDVAAFTSWLAVRAIDQQSKKLDVLESREPAAPIPGR